MSHKLVTMLIFRELMRKWKLSCSLKSKQLLVRKRLWSILKYWHMTAEINYWSRFLVEKMIVAHIAKIFVVFYGTKGFSTASPKTLHCTLWASWIHSISLYHILKIHFNSYSPVGTICTTCFNKNQLVCMLYIIWGLYDSRYKQRLFP
jgi:hypothetical protein